MNNWGQPTSASPYVDVLTQLHELINKAATQLADITGDTAIPTDAIRWSSVDNKWTKYDGATWNELTTAFDINVLKLDAKVGAFYLDYSNMGGTIQPGVLNDAAHGILAGGTAHVEATDVLAGFLSAADKAKLDTLAVLSDAEIATAYGNEVIEASPYDITTAEIRRYSPELAAKVVDGYNRKAIFDTGADAAVFNIDDGLKQKSTYTAAATITFTDHPATAWEMDLYLTTGGFTITLPAGMWAGGTPIVLAGYCILKVRYDGTNYIYEAINSIA